MSKILFNLLNKGTNQILRVVKRSFEEFGIYMKFNKKVL